MEVVPDWKLDASELARMNQLHRILEDVLFGNRAVLYRQSILDLSEYSGHPVIRTTMIRLCRSEQPTISVAAHSVLQRLHNLEANATTCCMCPFFVWPDERKAGFFRDYLGYCSKKGKRTRAGKFACEESGLKLPERRKSRNRN